MERHPRDFRRWKDVKCTAASCQRSQLNAILPESQHRSARATNRRSSKSRRVIQSDDTEPSTSTLPACGTRRLRLGARSTHRLPAHETAWRLERVDGRCAVAFPCAVDQPIDAVAAGREGDWVGVSPSSGNCGLCARMHLHTCTCVRTCTCTRTHT